MLLTISSTHSPTADLGYLLHKHPSRLQTFPMSGKVAGQTGRLDQDVNDRPYVASSFLSVSITKVFRTAMTGVCKNRPELANTPIPLMVNIPVLPCREGESFLRAASAAACGQATPSGSSF